MSPAAPLSYREMLRTLGGVLDAAGSALAVIHLTPRGARLYAEREGLPVRWSMAALAEAARQQCQQRATASAATAAPWARRLGWKLRLVGGMLDLDRPGACTLVVRPEEILVFNARGYRRTFAHAALERAAALAPAFRGQPTTCPVCDEPESLVQLLPAEGEELPASAGPTHRCQRCGAGVRLAPAEAP
ncbi:MAG TPA: hypothetical protein VFB73_18640 [Chloroflexota bacterium]|nr:hypothetical protein [Chloroflexota bacterium]